MLFDLQIFSGGVYPPSTTSRTISFSISNSFCYYHSNEAVLAKIGWPTLAWGRRHYKLLLVWRLVNGEGPPSLSSFFSLPLSSRSHYSLRNPHSLPQVLCHSSHRLKDFLPSAIALWNRLPSCICFCKTSRSFLAELDNHFSGDKFSFGLPWPVFFLFFFMFIL